MYRWYKNTYTTSRCPMSWMKFAACCLLLSSLSASIPHFLLGEFASCSFVKYHFSSAAIYMYIYITRFTQMIHTSARSYGSGGIGAGWTSDTWSVLKSHWLISRYSFEQSKMASYHDIVNTLEKDYCLTRIKLFPT